MPQERKLLEMINSTQASLKSAAAILAPNLLEDIQAAASLSPEQRMAGVVANLTLPSPRNMLSEHELHQNIADALAAIKEDGNTIEKRHILGLTQLSISLLYESIIFALASALGITIAELTLSEPLLQIIIPLIPSAISTVAMIIKSLPIRASKITKLLSYLETFYVTNGAISVLAQILPFYSVSPLDSSVTDILKFLASSVLSFFVLPLIMQKKCEFGLRQSALVEALQTKALLPKHIGKTALSRLASAGTFALFTIINEVLPSAYSLPLTVFAGIITEYTLMCFNAESRQILMRYPGPTSLHILSETVKLSALTQGAIASKDTSFVSYLPFIQNPEQVLVQLVAAFLVTKEIPGKWEEFLELAHAHMQTHWAGVSDRMFKTEVFKQANLTFQESKRLGNMMGFWKIASNSHNQSEASSLHGENEDETQQRGWLLEEHAASSSQGSYGGAASSSQS